MFPSVSASSPKVDSGLIPIPEVTIIPKRSDEDTTLSTTNSQGENIVVPIPKGFDVHINVVALHYNRASSYLMQFAHS
jgi:hypothetical protein